MAATMRPCAVSDIPAAADLLVRDAEQRRALDNDLWVIATEARQRIAAALAYAITGEDQPFRQHWLVAEHAGDLVGIAHTTRLPVPPIYAGKWGDPGLVMPEFHVSPEAPDGTLCDLLDAAEEDLRASGASILLASFVYGTELRVALEARGYEPLTLYLSRSCRAIAAGSDDVRPATESDLQGVLALSADCRATLHALDAFWMPHPDADARFHNWMKKSLTLTDRDLIVAGAPGEPTGYVIAQPASQLHFPPAHEIAAIGVIDDFFHNQFADPEKMGEDYGGERLLHAAETAFGLRGISTAFVVCPAAWSTKVAMLKRAGYQKAMTWMIKR